MKKNFIIRKSWVDELTELGRCSDFDLAVMICKPGYKIFDEEGNVLYTTYSENKFGSKWLELKSQLENDVDKLKNKKFPLVFRSELYSILNSLVEIIKMMNTVEKEEN